MKKWLAASAFLVSQAFAITGGPNMPEYTQFEEVSASNLVDPNSGNFTYSVPLLEVPGPEGTYPVALSYHSGIRYNQEASWVGLGWSVNVGAINRILRGVPDDYFNSVVATRNVVIASGRTLNVNLGLGNFGLSMSWDANTGQFLGETPSLILGVPGVEAFDGLLGLGLNVTLTPGSVSVGLSGTLPVGTVSLGLYDSKNNSAGSGLAFSPGLGGVSVSHAQGSIAQTGAGTGTTHIDNVGVGIPLGNVHIYVGLTNWRYSLDESIVDYMCGFLFQDGIGAGFSNRVPSAKPLYDRSDFGGIKFPSSDIYQVSANGLTGSFQPLVEPGAPLLLQNGISLNQITFRMDGDQGFNLLHDDPTATNPNQIAPYPYNYTVGTQPKRNQYGSYRIMPIFDKVSGSTTFNNVLTGFIILNADGMTYEYTQPVNSLLQADYAFKDATISTIDRIEKVNAEKYATSWLLTSVKGADYLAQNHTDLPPRPGDFGHWVRFNYTVPVLSNWSAPYNGNAPPDSKTSTGYYNRSYGIRQLVYLKSIETQTHRADFSTVDRVDVPVSKNNPTANAGQMTYDDGLVASNYYNATSSSPTMPYPVTGSFPILFSTATALAGTGNAHQIGSFTIKFPGDWGKGINDYRKASCNGNQCANEKIFGFHYKYQWLDACPTCPSNNYQPGDDIGFTGIFTVNHVNNFASEFNVNCPTVSVNGNGETEAVCNFDAFGSTDMKNINIYSAFINWPRLEALGIIAYMNKPQALSGITITEKASGQLTKEIRFGYDYSLCNGIPGHPGISGVAAQYASQGVYLSTDDVNNKGKLTLKKVSIYGTGGKATGFNAKLPDYTFEYPATSEFNPKYGTTYQNDYWGMYSPTSGIGTHSVQQTNSAPSGSTPNGGEKVGVCWNLQKIHLPTGGVITLDYQRDEFYYAGLATDLSTQKKSYLLPDVFDLDIQSAGTIAYNKYFQLTTTTTPFSTTVGQLQKNTRTANFLQTSDVGPDGKDDFAISSPSTPSDLKNGDVVFVVFAMDRKSQKSGEADWVRRFVGINNIAIVTRTDIGAQKRVKLLPLVQKNSAGKFFYYLNPKVTNSGIGSQYQISYYLIPIKNSASKLRFYGGDVAVKSINLDDGLNSPVTKNFSYSADGRRNASGTIIDSDSTSSGSTWSLPDLAPSDRYDKYMQGFGDELGKLHFDPWPYFCTDPNGNPNGPCSSAEDINPPPHGTTNILTTFLDATFKPDTRIGGYYYPDAGITYARTTEKTVDGTNSLAGSTEYQFYNLAHNLLNENGIVYNPAAPTSRLEFGDWIVTVPTTNNYKVEGKLLALNGKLMRKLEINSSGKIVTSNHKTYSTNPGVYTDATSAPTNKTLGAVQQKLALTGGTLTMLTPNAYLISEENTQDQVTANVLYPMYDAKSGEPLVTISGNSESNGRATYKIPLHWINPAAALPKNRLSLSSEERIYSMMTYTNPFDRNSTYDIMSAVYNQWQTPPIQKSVNSSTTSGFLYKTQSYQWRDELYEGFPGNGYSPFTTSTDPHWKPGGNKITLLNVYGYPLESINEVTGMRRAEFTGYGSNLVIGTVTNSKWVGSSIYTCDYGSATGASLDALSGWTRNIDASVLVTAEAKHYGAKGIKLLGGGILSNPNIDVDAAHKKMTLQFNTKVLSGTIQVQIQPMTGTSFAGSSKIINVSSTSWGSYSIEIDLSQSQYAGATSLNLGFWAMGTASGYIDDVRFAPSDALVRTNYYDPGTYKLIAAVDENKCSKSFVYDARGRLAAIRNNAGTVVSQATYNDYQ